MSWQFRVGPALTWLYGRTLTYSYGQPFFYSTTSTFRSPKQVLQIYLQLLGSNLSGFNWQPTGMFAVFLFSHPAASPTVTGRRGCRSLWQRCVKLRSGTGFLCLQKKLIDWITGSQSHVLAYIPVFLFWGGIYFCSCVYPKKKEIRFYHLLVFLYLYSRVVAGFRSWMKAKFGDQINHSVFLLTFLLKFS